MIHKLPWVTKSVRPGYPVYLGLRVPLLTRKRTPLSFWVYHLHWTISKTIISAVGLTFTPFFLMTLSKGSRAFIYRFNLKRKIFISLFGWFVVLPFIYWPGGKYLNRTLRIPSTDYKIKICMNGSRVLLHLGKLVTRHVIHNPNRTHLCVWEGERGCLPCLGTTT